MADASKPLDRRRLTLVFLATGATIAAGLVIAAGAVSQNVALLRIGMFLLGLELVVWAPTRLLIVGMAGSIPWWTWIGNVIRLGAGVYVLWLALFRLH